MLGEQHPPPPLNPTMSLSEKDLFESMLLTKNGFIDVKSQQSSYPIILPNEEEFCFKLTTMVVKDKLEELKAWDQARDAYNELSPQYISVDEDGSNLVDGNVFKLTLCTKATVEDRYDIQMPEYTSLSHKKPTVWRSNRHMSRSHKKTTQIYVKV